MPTLTHAIAFIVGGMVGGTVGIMALAVLIAGRDDR